METVQVRDIARMNNEYNGKCHVRWMARGKTHKCHGQSRLHTELA